MAMLRLNTCLLLAKAVAGIVVHQEAEWAIKEVATISVASDLPGLPGKSLVGTTFGPFGKDSVFALGPLAQGKDANVTVLSDKFSWPNEAYHVDAETKAKAKMSGEFIAVADGFLFPGKQTGGIHLLDVTQGLIAAQKTTISEVKHAWFYHHSTWFDVDGDNVLDVVAARSVKPLIRGHTDSELIWIKNNGDGTWGATQVITKGPGVGFDIVDVDGDNRAEIVATEFFLHQQLAIYSCPEATWAECASKQNVVATVIDTGDGPYFQCSWVDLNGDGRKDILATAQQHSENKNVIPGKVLAFEQPVGKAGNWTRHVLADGYLPQPKQPAGSGAPGVASAFSLNSDKSKKPYVILTGDDGGVVDLLSPVSDKPGDWAYSKQTLYVSKKATQQGVNTIGSVLVAEVGGSSKLFVASYAENKLLMFSIDSSVPELIV